MSGAAPIRVVVVDDDFMVARLHSSVVARHPDFEVVGVAHTGGDAVRQIAALAPELVLLDVYLPDMTGMEVLRQLRLRERSGTDVIVITAARDVETLRTALHRGVFQYLVKPFELDVLRSRLDEYARHRSDLAALSAARQDDVDRLFRTAGRAGTTTPKGISPETVELVRTALAAAGADGMSAVECAEATSLSRSSTRRYLEHLVDSGEAEVRPRYGVAGRPERRYHPL